MSRLTLQRRGQVQLVEHDPEAEQGRPGDQQHRLHNHVGRLVRLKVSRSSRMPLLPWAKD